MSATKPRKPFIVILVVLIVIVAIGIVLFSIRMFDAVKNDPQSAAGAAHVIGADTPAQAQASVTTGAKRLSADEVPKSATGPQRDTAPPR